MSPANGSAGVREPCLATALTSLAALLEEAWCRCDEELWPEYGRNRVCRGPRRDLGTAMGEAFQGKAWRETSSEQRWCPSQVGEKLVDGKIPWMEEPGRLQSMESQSRTQLSDFTHTHTHTHTHRRD